MINYYHRFIPQGSETMNPLYELIASHNNKNKSTFILTNTCEKAIDKIKAKLAKATMLVHPKPDAHYSLTTNASDLAIGAVLQQQIEGRVEPIAFYSKKSHLRNNDIPHLIGSY